MSKLIFDEAAWEDYLWWQRDKKTFDKINALLKEILRHPTEGAGRPGNSKALRTLGADG